MIEKHGGYVQLSNTFEKAWDYLRNNELDLHTSVGTSFQVKTGISRDNRDVIKFYQKGKEYARAYGCCWEHYYNCNRTRFGMYAKALDDYLKKNRK